MRLYVTWRDRDVIDLTVTAARKSTASLRVWEKTSKPAEKKEEGPPLRATGHCLSIERRGRTNAPDTRVFGFGGQP